jgi:F-type H+-transporting ATPase subunit a
MKRAIAIFLPLFLVLQANGLYAQHHGNEQHGDPHAQEHPTATPADQHQQPATGHETPASEASHGDAHADHGAEHHDAHAEESGPYNPTGMIMHHIADANEFHVVGDITVPLPCILYAKDQGLSVFLSSAFHHGAMVVDGYALVHGDVQRVVGFPQKTGAHELEEVPGGHGHGHHYVLEEADGSRYVLYQGNKYALEGASSLMGFTSWFDFSITKNVATMLFTSLLLIWLFLSVASAYKKRVGQAPTGLQNLIEVIVVFVRDDVVKPNIPDQWQRFLPYILSIFFFILINNLIGLVPFFPGSANVTGNIATTFALAIIAFLVTNLNGNSAYWGHIFWVPGVPVPMKIFLLPIELIGVFTKPISLFIRLFANITAGHIIILSLISLIFVFGNAGESVPGSLAGMGLAIPFTLFMNIIELIVAFMQAFIFSLLTASYIGAAVAVHHHDDHH